MVKAFKALTEKAAQRNHAAQDVYKKGIDLAKSLGLRTEMLEDHMQRGEVKAADKNATQTRFDKRDGNIYITDQDVQKAQLALDPSLSFEERANALLDSEWLRTIYHEAAHSMIVHYLSLDPKTDPMAAKIQELHAATVKHFQANPQLQNGANIIDFDRVAHEALAQYVGDLAYDYSVAVVRAQDVAATNGKEGLRASRNTLQNIATGGKAEPKGYQLHPNGSQLGVATPLPESIREDLDLIFFDGVEWRVTKTAAVRGELK
jgi:hypothetical protein